MGEVFHALEALNRTMKLGLKAPDLLRAEMGIKSALARQGNPDPSAQRVLDDPVALAEGFELVTTLRPRAQALSLRELSTLARKEVSSPRTKVDAKVLKQIDKALAAAAKDPKAGAAAAGAAKTGAAKTGAAKTGAAKTGALKAGPTKAATKTSSAKKAPAKKATAKKGGT